MTSPEPLSPDAILSQLVKLQLPPDVIPCVWVTEYDNTPLMLPRWPTSPRMSLVCVIRDSSTTDETEEIYWLPDESVIDLFMPLIVDARCNALACFFHIPTSVVEAHTTK